MALVVVNNPENAGLTEVAKRSTNQLGLVAFHKPIWDSLLYQQSPKWWFSFFLENYVGEDEPISADEFFWAEDGRPFDKQTITSALANGSDWDLTMANSDPYFTVNDVVDLGKEDDTHPGTNILGRVKAVDTSGATEVITVEIIDPEAGISLVVGDFTNNEVQVIYNSFGECFKMPAGRIRTPEKYTNQLTKISDTYEVCDDAENRTIWFRNTKTGQFFWTDEEEGQVGERHMMKRDHAILMGKRLNFTDTIDGTAYDGRQGYGIIPLLSLGAPVRRFAGSAIEEDYQDMLTTMSTYSKYNTWHYICGVDAQADFNKAMKDYHVHSYPAKKEFHKSGLQLEINVEEYRFAGRTMKVMEYQGFSDPFFLPTTGVDWKKFGMFLNLESGDIKVCYKKRKRGGKYRNWMSPMDGVGMQARSGQNVNLDQACRKNNWLTHVGVKFKGILNHGLMYGTA